MRWGVRVAMALVLPAVAPVAHAQRTWTLVEDLRLGTGDGPNSFGVVGAIAVARNGNIFVVDRQPLQIKVFSPTGAFVRAVGRTGGGPGEYRDVAALHALPDGNVIAIAPQSARVITYSGDGLLVRDVVTRFPSYGGDWMGGVLPDGSLVDPIHLFPPNWRSTTSEPPRALQRVRANGTRADTLLHPECQVSRPSTDVVVRIPQGRGYWQTRVPFMPVPQLAFANDGTVWCTPTDAYAVFHFRVGRADTLHTVRLSVPAPPIPDSARAMMDGLLARAENTRNILVPTAQPVIQSIRIDDVNRLWVRRVATPAATPSFDLYDAQGRALGVVTSAVRWERIPLVAGAYAYGVVLGADDVPFVVRARLSQ